jgi:hypothetical protein
MTMSPLPAVRLEIADQRLDHPAAASSSPTTSPVMSYNAIIEALAASVSWRRVRP